MLIATAIMLAAVSETIPVASDDSVVERIPGPDGSYDYISVDGASGRVFVARGNGVMAIDLATNSVTPVLVEGDDVAAVAIITGTNLMLSTNSNANTATLFNRTSGAVKLIIPTGTFPDAALFDETSGLAFVMNWQSHDITVIDIGKAAAVATIAVGGNPEAAIAGSDGRLFVNIEDTAEIAEINIVSRKVTRRFSLSGCSEPTGLAYDPDTNLLISACHNGTAKLIDSVTGVDRGSVVIGQGADGAIFDVYRRLAYIPCFDGLLTVFQLDHYGHASGVTRVKTRIGARTAALDEKTGRLYLPTADYVIDSDGERHRVPGTFVVLVVAP